MKTPFRTVKKGSVEDRVLTHEHWSIYGDTSALWSAMAELAEELDKVKKELRNGKNRKAYGQ